jgi:predicted nuclease of predicted toxin-antitoxin system
MIIADENIFRALILSLRNEGYEVISIFESYRGMDDASITAFSLNPPRIVITEDKDFGKLVFEDKADVTGIIFLRFLNAERSMIINKLLSFLKNENLLSLTGKFVTITPDKIRITDI